MNNQINDANIKLMHVWLDELNKDLNCGQLWNAQRTVVALGKCLEVIQKQIGREEVNNGD